MASKRPSLHQAADIQELLLQSKAIEAITREQLEELRRISTLGVSQYSEADVRAEIIDPVVPHSRLPKGDLLFASARKIPEGIGRRPVH